MQNGSYRAMDFHSGSIATGRSGGLAAAHAASATVFPEPGGPVTTVSGPCAPTAITFSMRCRGTIHPGAPGTVIFEMRNESSAPMICLLRCADAGPVAVGIGAPYPGGPSAVRAGTSSQPSYYLV